jgi:hypothetical protein
MWKEMMVAKSEVLHWYLSDETEENHGKTQSKNLMCQYSNLKPPEYKEGVLPTRPRCGHIYACPCVAWVATLYVKEKSIHPFEVIFSCTNRQRNVGHLQRQRSTHRHVCN